MKLKSLLLGTAMLALAFTAWAADPALKTQPQMAGNGSILETENGFPYPTYEEWLEPGRGEMKFDEARVRAQFPPDKFQEFKDKLPTKANTYEEFLALAKRRFETMAEKRPEIEAEMRRACSPELFRDFKETVDCQRIHYASDGLKIRGFILKPRSLPAGRLPAIIYNHGGNPRVGIIDDAKLMHLTWLVRAGYVVVASQYRGGGGSEGNDEMGGADVADVLNLIPLIGSLPYADAGSIGMLGWSRGGMMTYLTLSRSSRIAAAVIGAGPTDLFAELKRRPVMESLLERSVPDYAGNKEAALKARSAQFWPDKLCQTTPILLLQGSDDQSCVPRSALDMALLLQQSKRPFRLIFFESGSHDLREHTDEVNQQTLRWFEKYLRRQTAETGPDPN